MARIDEEVSYDGAKERIERLGLSPLINEIRTAFAGFDLRVKEAVDANGGAAVRKMIDAAFQSIGDGPRELLGTLIGASAMPQTAPPCASELKFRFRPEAICWLSILFISPPPFAKAASMRA